MPDIKDREAAKIKAEARAKEIDHLRGVLTNQISRVPQSVIQGSHQDAVSWKEAAHRAKLAIARSHPSLDAMRELAATLGRYK